MAFNRFLYQPHYGPGMPMYHSVCFITNFPRLWGHNLSLHALLQRYVSLFPVWTYLLQQITFFPKISSYFIASQNK